MSKSIDKVRIRNKYNADTITDLSILGGDGSDDAKTYGGLAAMLAQGVSEMASSSLKKKEDEAKNKDANQANANAQKLRKDATFASAEARAARAKANASPSDSSLKTLADDAETRAAHMEADARAAEEKAAFYSGGNRPMQQGMYQQNMPAPGGGGSTLFTPVNILIGLGAIIGLGIGFKLLKGRAQ